MKKLRSLFLLLALALLTTAAMAAEPILVYRADDWMTAAVGYDTEADAPVELVRLGLYRGSVLRRVLQNGQPGSVIWRTEGEAHEPGVPCGFDLEFSAKLSGYVVAVNIGANPRTMPRLVYLVGREREGRLLARTLRTPTQDYPEYEDDLEPGVIGLRWIGAVMLAADGEHILINGSQEGPLRQVRAHCVDAAKGRVTDILDGKVLGVTAEGYLVPAGTGGWKSAEAELPSETKAWLARTPLLPVPGKDVVRLVQAGDRRAEMRENMRVYIYKTGGLVAASAGVAAATRPDSAAEFKGCATEPLAVTGVWATKRGTFMVAGESDLNKIEKGLTFFVRHVHCLYEVP